MIGDVRLRYSVDVIDETTSEYFVILSPQSIYSSTALSNSSIVPPALPGDTQSSNQLKAHLKTGTSRKTIRLIQLITLLTSFLFFAMFPKLPPLISGSLPAPQQQGALPLGHVYLRTPPISNFSIPSPTLTSTGKPALEVREVAYSVFYPCEPKLKGYKKWISWVVEPTKGIVEGYEKFVGKSGPGWICEFTICGSD